MRSVLLTAASILGFAIAEASLQSTLVKQARDGGPVQQMSASELSDLGDPFFRLVLQGNPLPVQLDAIEKLLVGTQGQRHLFVVSEELQDPASGPGASRRAVIAFSGSTSLNGQLVRLDPNVMLSVSFGDQAFGSIIEAWGWDDSRSRYNYYKLDGQPLRWKFRGSSVGADRLTAAERAGTCMSCHINGAPIMKELPFPWNNWHSFRNVVPYLSPTSQGHWSIAETPRFKDLRGAEALEVSFVLPAIRQFNGRRLTDLTRRNTTGQPVAVNGFHEITDGPRLLRSLFQTTEYNIGSAGQLSGLHPLSPSPGGTPESINVPGAFFLDVNLLAGGGPTQYAGLGIQEALDFNGVLRLDPAEYQSVVARFQTKLAGQAGDTNFAWFVPVPSHVDGHMIDLLIRQGVITQDFAAAVLAIDIETPIFSEAREELLSLVPSVFQFKPVNTDSIPAAHPDELTNTVIAKLQNAKPAVGTAQAELLNILQNANPKSVLRQRVTAYLGRLRARLANPQGRAEEIARLYGVMLQRRRDAASRIPVLVESPRLFPAGSAQ